MPPLPRFAEEWSWLLGACRPTHPGARTTRLLLIRHQQRLRLTGTCKLSEWVRTKDVRRTDHTRRERQTTKTLPLRLFTKTKQRRSLCRLSIDVAEIYYFCFKPDYLQKETTACTHTCIVINKNILTVQRNTRKMLGILRVKTVATSKTTILVR